MIQPYRDRCRARSRSRQRNAAAGVCFAGVVLAATVLGLSVATAEQPGSDAESIVEGPERDAVRGVWRYQVAGPYLNGRNAVEVLLPDGFDPNQPHRVLYVLPVEPGVGGRYGDGLVEVRKTGLHNRARLICVAPAFPTTPWYMDHAEDARQRHESHLLKVVVPLMDARYPTVAKPEGRLLLGFSKSGWGAFTLLLRHPDVFGAAASWDAPLMLLDDDWQRFGVGRAAGTIENFRRYQPRRLLVERADGFRQRTRFALLGYKSFGPNGGPAYAGAHTHTRWAHDTMTRLGIRHVYNNEVVVSHAWDGGWVGPALAALLSIAESPIAAPKANGSAPNN